MKRSNRLVLLIGVFLAVLAFVFVIILLSGQNPPQDPNATPPPTKVATVIASRDIALGVTITKDMLKSQDLEPDVRLPGAFKDASQVVGSVTRQAIKTGQQITTVSFTEQNANFQCPAGFTCIALQVDQLSGVGTLIKTGDYVDMVAGISPLFPILDSKTVVKIPDENYDHTSVKVLLQGMQVVTTLLPPPPTAETGVATAAPGASAAPAAGGGGTALNGQQEIVILAVTPQQAEVIKFAQLDGSITLTLRSPLDFVDDQGNPVVPQTVTTTGIVLRTMITDYGVLPPKVIIDLQPVAAP
ncbi:MAG: Flp pilus assembly protein CpaB [Chloroflexota bacterium]